MKKIILIIVILSVAALYYFYYPNSLVVGQLESKIDSLNVEIEIKKDSIQLAENKINVLEDKVFFAEEKLAENKAKIKNIYEEYDTQVQIIDSYDVNQLEQFFSDRYKDSADIK